MASLEVSSIALSREETRRIVAALSKTKGFVKPKGSGGSFSVVLPELREISDYEVMSDYTVEGRIHGLTSEKFEAFWRLVAAVGESVKKTHLALEIEDSEAKAAPRKREEEGDVRAYFGKDPDGAFIRLICWGKDHGRRQRVLNEFLGVMGLGSDVQVIRQGEAIDLRVSGKDFLVAPFLAFGPLRTEEKQIVIRRNGADIHGRNFHELSFSWSRTHESEVVARRLTNSLGNRILRADIRIECTRERYAGLIEDSRRVTVDSWEVSFLGKPRHGFDNWEETLEKSAEGVLVVGKIQTKRLGECTIEVVYDPKECFIFLENDDVSDELEAAMRELLDKAAGRNIVDDSV